MCVVSCMLSYLFCICTVCEQNSVRLVGGPSEYEGRVEVCNNQEWGTVCQTFWEDVDAGIACSQLGFSRFGEFRSKNEICFLDRFHLLCPYICLYTSLQRLYMLCCI